MALDKNALQKELKTALLKAAESNAKDGVSLDTAMENLANAISCAVDSFVRSAEVTVTALTGEVKVVGSPSSQQNADPLTFKGGDETHSGGLS